MKDRDWLAEAIELSRLCPPSTTAYAVGAVVVDTDGGELARGYSRETDPYDHAEESVLAKLSSSLVDLTGATLYSSLEPCTARRSRTRTCTELIIAAGLRRVVFALREPPVLAECHGVALLGSAGVEVVEINDLGDLVRAVNRELIERHGA
jgi:diaminohydroxyphosphoribosylaminopyrimidine deaminase/5-amino-6-(5-phosphoribosylamino)uracil reductase